MRMLTTLTASLLLSLIFLLAMTAVAAAVGFVRPTAETATAFFVATTPQRREMPSGSRRRRIGGCAALTSRRSPREGGGKTMSGEAFAGLSSLRCLTEDTRGDNGSDDDDAEIKPYGNRSLAWTKRYRRLNPYEKCRQRVIRFGHRSKEDFFEARESGQLGQYVPTYPETMYAPEWQGWEEFLGISRPYDETRNIAVNVLGLTNLDSYILFVRSDSARAEGLRIPLRPDLYYRDDWINGENFFRKDVG